MSYFLIHGKQKTFVDNIGFILYNLSKVIMMKNNFRNTLNKELKKPEFAKAWEELEPNFQIINAIIDARKKRSLTQKQLSELTGIAQGDISKLENGTANPSIRTLQRLAKGMGMNLKIEFIVDEK